jgi:hypothetical protein
MRALRILFRHRVTSWLRDPSWGTGTVVGQVVLLGLLLAFLFPVGLLSYVLGDVLRETVPGTDPLALINGGMLYLVPALLVSRFLFQSPPSERMGPYAALPLSRTGLLNGQVVLSLLSVHTVFAVVLVGPVWAAEIATAWAPVTAGVWLLTALLLTVVLAAEGATLLHLLLGRRPWWFAGGLALGAGLFAADALLGPDLFRAVSRALFGQPVLGLACAGGLVTGTHAALLRVMRQRLEVDQRTVSRRGAPSAWGQAVYRWIERTLPAGRLAALELRQILRTRRLRGMTLMGILIVIYFYGLEILSSDTAALIAPDGFIMICFFGIAGPAYMLGFWLFGTWAGHVNGLFARPHPLGDVMLGRTVVLWMGLVPGTLVTVGILPWLPLSQAAFLIGMVLFWWGGVVPSFVYFGPHFRTPVDPSASMFTMSTNMHGLRLLPLMLAVIVAPVVALLTGAWWIVGGLAGGLGIAGLLSLAWTRAPLARKLDRHRRKMVEAFREKEPI